MGFESKLSRSSACDIYVAFSNVLWRLCVSGKGGTGGGEWAHPKRL